MKKQTQKATKTKKTPRQAKEATKWFDHARTLPLALFHTTAGQIIGRIEKATGPDAGAFNVRVWAPAVIRMGFESMQPGATSMNSKLAVTFNTIALVETYIDLSAMTPFGRSPVPDALVPSYEQYFDRVVAGDYAFNRVVQHLEQTASHVAVVEPSDQELHDGVVEAAEDLGLAVVDVSEAASEEPKEQLPDEESTTS